MIEYVTGNLLEADVEALVNPVNCAGVMGKGLALQFKQAFPAVYREYRKAALAGDVQPGRMHVVAVGASLDQLVAKQPATQRGPSLVVNFPTKRHWRSKARMEDIDSGLVALAALVHATGIRSVALPPLGAGLGGLPWPVVRQRIEHALGGLPGVRVLVYEPLAQDH